MDYVAFRNSLEKAGVRKIITLTSRKSVGVWSLLPSLACQNLSDMQTNTNVLLIDFGNRHEMLEHLQADPDWIPPSASLTYACKTSNRSEPFSPLEYFQDFVFQTTRYPNLLLRKDYGDNYRNLAVNFSKENKKLFLCPFHLGSSENQNFSLSNEEFSDGLFTLINSCRPWLVYLTFEGQPERPLFDKKLAESQIMQYCLNLGDSILSLVRTDSETRFNESVAIPNFLAINPQWESKILLFLTRHLDDIVIPSGIHDFVIGQSPFFDLVGQSIQSGRIPWIDFKIERYGLTSRDKINQYFVGLQRASQLLLNL